MSMGAIGGAVLGSVASGVTSKIMGGGSGGGSTAMQQPMMPPWLEKYYKELMPKAKELSEQEFAAYDPEDLVASLSEDEKAAFDLIRQQGGQFLPYTMDALGGTQSLLAQLAGGPSTEDIQTRMNPYLDQVLERQRMGAERTYDTTKQRLADQAVASSAFGGSRQGVEEQEARQAYARQLGDIETKGISDAYEQARAQYNQDQARRMGGFAQLANLGASGLSQLGSQASMLQLAGQQQRGIDQALSDARYQEFMREERHPYEQLQFLQSMLQPTGQAFTGQQVTNETQNPEGSLFGKVLGGAAMGAGVGDWVGDKYSTWQTNRDIDTSIANNPDIFADGGQVQGYADGGMIDVKPGERNILASLLSQTGLGGGPFGNIGGLLMSLLDTGEEGEDDKKALSLGGLDIQGLAPLLMGQGNFGGLGSGIVEGEWDNFGGLGGLLSNLGGVGGIANMFADGGQVLDSREDVYNRLLSDYQTTTDTGGQTHTFGRFGTSDYANPFELKNAIFRMKNRFGGGRDNPKTTQADAWAMALNKWHGGEGTPIMGTTLDESGLNTAVDAFMENQLKTADRGALSPIDRAQQDNMLGAVADIQPAIMNQPPKVAQTAPLQPHAGSMLGAIAQPQVAPAVAQPAPAQQVPTQPLMQQGLTGVTDPNQPVAAANPIQLPVQQAQPLPQQPLQPMQQQQQPVATNIFGGTSMFSEGGPVKEYSDGGSVTAFQRALQENVKDPISSLLSTLAEKGMGGARGVERMGQFFTQPEDVYSQDYAPMMDPMIMQSKLGGALGRLQSGEHEAGLLDKMQGISGLAAALNEEEKKAEEKKAPAKAPKAPTVVEKVLSRPAPAERKTVEERVFGGTNVPMMMAGVAMMKNKGDGFDAIADGMAAFIGTKEKLFTMDQEDKAQEANLNIAKQQSENYKLQTQTAALKLKNAMNPNKRLTTEEKIDLIKAQASLNETLATMEPDHPMYAIMKRQSDMFVPLLSSVLGGQGMQVKSPIQELQEAIQAKQQN